MHFKDPGATLRLAELGVKLIYWVPLALLSVLLSVNPVQQLSPQGTLGWGAQRGCQGRGLLSGGSLLAALDCVFFSSLLCVLSTQTAALSLEKAAGFPRNSAVRRRGRVS